MSCIKNTISLIYFSAAVFAALSAEAAISPESIIKQSSGPKLTPEQISVTIPTTPNPLTSLHNSNSNVNDHYWQMKNHLAAKSAIANNKPAKIKITGNRGRGTITLSKFGTGKSQSNTAQVSGTVDLPPIVTIDASPEDNGSIPLASELGLISGNAVEVSSVIGDGAFGIAGSGSGDFDFYVIRGVTEGELIGVEVNTADPFAPLDPAVAIYDSVGNIVAFNDDSRGTFDSFVIAAAPASGDYFVSIGTFGNPILNDPFDSSSGNDVDFTFGIANEGEYTATISLEYFEEKFITFTPKKGDVVGAALNGVPGQLELIDNSGTVRQGTMSNASSSFDTGSPLPAGNVSVGHVVDKPGRFTLRMLGMRSGDYTVDLGAFLPKLRTGERGEVQTIFLDFDGASVDLSESIFAGFPFPIDVTLSPLSAFLADWGLTAGDENAVIDAIIERVEESLVRDIDQLGPNPKFEIRLLNSRDHDDPWGQPNVSRLIIGGTIAELAGIGTIGIAQSIDVGNYDTEETAFILLDILSGQIPSSINLNNVPRAPGESIIDIIGVGVGEITAHEAGHYLGNWHTDQFNAIANIMDQGGNLNFSILGLGPDGIFGTSDDTNVQFEKDVFNPNEPFTGIEDTKSATAFGSTQPK